MAAKKVLNIISESYPYGKAEQFFDLEVKFLAGKFDVVNIYPLSKVEEVRELPDNVIIIDRLNETSRSVSIGHVIKHSILLLKVIGYEIFKSSHQKTILKRLKYMVYSIVIADRLGKTFLRELDSKNDNYFYSFWMNEGALMLSILKSKGKVASFDFRVNGHDIFNERHDGNYLPFRNYNYRHVRQVFVLSNPALKYLEALDVFPEKLEISHYGMLNKGLNNLDDSEVIRLVSCSNVISLKRIDKIIDALALLTDIKVEWTHFGDGPLLPEMEEKAKMLNDNIKADFRGSVQHQEILDFYKNESVNIFIHTSETEGLGMAIVEAQSYGVPAVVIGVGGVTDVVSNATGIVLNPEAGGSEIAKAIRELLTSDLNSQEYRLTIKNHCMGRFGAATNYTNLYNKLTRL